MACKGKTSPKSYPGHATIYKREEKKLLLQKQTCIGMSMTSNTFPAVK